MPNTHKTIEGTFLGFDFGTKYIGIAVGQTITKTATPLLSLSAKHGVPQWEQIQKLIDEWQPKGCVIGLALQLDDSASPTSLAAQKFGRRLHARFHLPIYFIGERLTTVAAREILKEKYPTTHHLQDIDAMSAAVILESWLNSSPKEASYA